MCGDDDLRLVSWLLLRSAKLGWGVCLFFVRRCLLVAGDKCGGWGLLVITCGFEDVMGERSKKSCFLNPSFL